jgi:hypothetical protein
MGGGPTVPLDSEGFVVTFAADEDSAIREFLDVWGFVAVRECLGTAECEDTLADCFKYLEDEAWRRGGDTEAAVGGVRRGDSRTWESGCGWPSGMAQSEGIIGEHIAWTRRSLVNRMNPALYRVFSALLGESDLLVSHDRYGFFRPAATHPERATDRNLHFDCNPWTKFNVPVDNAKARTSQQDARPVDAAPYADEGDFIREGNYAETAGLQAMINLIDNRSEDGGFHCVPQFHKRVAAWAAQHPELGGSFASDATFCPFFWEPSPGSKGEDAIADASGLSAEAQRVPLRRGVLLVWDQLLPHGSSPNCSLTPRAVQLLTLRPAAAIGSPAERIARAEVVLRRVRDVGALEEITDVGQRVFGFHELEETSLQASLPRL